MPFQCIHCSRNFSIPYTLKWHISSKHSILTQSEESAFILPIASLPIYEEPGLWEDLEIASNYSSDSSNVLEYEEEMAIISEYEEMVK